MINLNSNTPDWNIFYNRLAAVTIDKLYSMFEDQVDLDTITNLVAADPTYPGGEDVGQFGPWIVQKFLHQDISIDQLDDVASTLSLFSRNKPKLEIRDIYQYATLNDVKDAIAPFVYYAPEEAAPEEAASAEGLSAEGLSAAGIPEDSIIYDDGTWIAIKPKTSEEACFYSKNTKWCTRDNFDLFERLDPTIILNVRTNEKFQFDLNDAQFMNESNQEGFNEFLEMNPPEQLLEVTGITAALEGGGESVSDVRAWYNQIEAEQEELVASGITYERITEQFAELSDSVLSENGQVDYLKLGEFIQDGTYSALHRQKELVDPNYPWQRHFERFFETAADLEHGNAPGDFSTLIGGDIKGAILRAKELLAEEPATIYLEYGELSGPVLDAIINDILDEVPWEEFHIGEEFDTSIRPGSADLSGNVAETQFLEYLAQAKEGWEANLGMSETLKQESRAAILQIVQKPEGFDWFGDNVQPILVEMLFDSATKKLKEFSNIDKSIHFDFAEERGSGVLYGTVLGEEILDYMLGGLRYQELYAHSKQASSKIDLIKISSVSELIQKFNKLEI